MNVGDEKEFGTYDLPPLGRKNKTGLSLADAGFQDFRRRWHIQNATKIDQILERSVVEDAGCAVLHFRSGTSEFMFEIIYIKENHFV